MFEHLARSYAHSTGTTGTTPLGSPNTRLTNELTGADQQLTNELTGADQQLTNASNSYTLTK